ncbi:hypothetical protein [Streptomyces sirii]|uniref:hypothetical protein n=1 Tax=Streptomyces sirii TaxID=3127701 RepID=UPI003D3663D3
MTPPSTPPRAMTRPSAIPSSTTPPSTTSRGRTPAAAAFDALHLRHAAALARQAYLLTGRPALARRAVERGFRLAWQRWPAVAVDPDPAGWVRAAVYEYALTPWHRLVPRLRTARKPTRLPASVPAADRALLAAVLDLPAVHRRTLLLHDGVGLGLDEAAAETEASAAAAAGRLTQARRRVAARLPELVPAGRPPAEQDWPGEVLRPRLTGLLAEEGRVMAEQEAGPAAARRVRAGGECSARRTTRAALALTGLFALLTLFVGIAAPDHSAPPDGRRSATTQPPTVTAREARLTPEAR